MKRILALVISIVLALTMLTGCGWAGRAANRGILSFGGQLYDVDDSAQFDIDGIVKVEIGTVSDEVTILYGEGKAVAELKGQCRSALGPVWLDARKEGSSLIIEVKYPRTIQNNNTRLTVILPAEYAGSLTAKTVSGGILAEGLPFQLQKVSLGTVSGEIRFGTAGYESLTAGTTSGGISVAGIAAQTSAKTVSGDIELEYETFAETSAATVSGSVTARIPRDAAFKVDYNTVSGSFRSSHAGITVDNARRGFSATVSDGSERIKVNTTSGDFRIEEE